MKLLKNISLLLTFIAKYLFAIDGIADIAFEAFVPLEAATEMIYSKSGQTCDFVGIPGIDGCVKTCHVDTVIIDSLRIERDSIFFSLSSPKKASLVYVNGTCHVLAPDIAIKNKEYNFTYFLCLSDLFSPALRPFHIDSALICRTGEDSLLMLTYYGRDVGSPYQYIEVWIQGEGLVSHLESYDAGNHYGYKHVELMNETHMTSIHSNSIFPAKRCENIDSPSIRRVFTANGRLVGKRSSQFMFSNISAILISNQSRRIFYLK